MSNEREGPCYADLRAIIRCVVADVQAEMLIRPEGIRAENTVADRERHPAYREQQRRCTGDRNRGRVYRHCTHGDDHRHIHAETIRPSGVGLLALDVGRRGGKPGRCPPSVRQGKDTPAVSIA